MKLIGILLILGAGGAIGLCRAYRLRSRPRQIRAVIQGLACLQAQIVYAQVRLDEAFRQAAPSTNEEAVKKLFQQVADELSADRRCEVGRAVVRVKKRLIRSLAIGEEEWNIISFLAENLGKSDTEEMKKQIELALKHLIVREHIAEERARQKEKLSVYLGFGGAILIILVCV